MAVQFNQDGILDSEMACLFGVGVWDEVERQRRWEVDKMILLFLTDRVARNCVPDSDSPRIDQPQVCKKQSSEKSQNLHKKSTIF